jgi:uncharacterized protein YyaL (SSP411 family)
LLEVVAENLGTARRTAALGLEWRDLIVLSFQGELEDPLLVDVLQLLPAEIPKLDPVRKLRSEQHACRLRHEDVPAAPRGTDPRRAHDIQADVPFLAHRRLAGVQAHPHLELNALRPGMFAECALCAHRAGDSVTRAREREEERIALGVDLAPSRVSEQLAEDPSLFAQHLRVALPESSHQLGRALDVCEQEGDRSARKGAHGQSMGVNRLAEETSPYLLQHADNPVDWYPWGEEALARAREEDRPILLSVGYSACHWCHVMEHESFEDEATAALMNEHYVPIKVDREERPDVDSVYMDAVVSLTGHGGWPMTVFLTPEGEPFFGGTYYPPEPRHGLPSFRQVLQAVADAWKERRTDIQRDAGTITERLRQTVEPSREPLTSSLLTDAVVGLRQQFDPVWGGFGNAPKFPSASVLEFLLRRGEVEMTTKTLDAMARGGMYDLVGGGFHRYSVDREWLVPHFEKMLYDNALLVPAYLHGWLVTGTERYREVAEETLEYMLRELRLMEGGFASAQDADTDGIEGLTYTWMGDDDVPRELLQPFEDGRLIIRGELDADTRTRLFAERERRPRPLRDDKAIASWNGLALAALAEAGRRLERADLVDSARAAAEFLLGPLSTADGRLHRTWRGGQAKHAGVLEDYADVANGLYELHVATGDLRWLEESRRLALLAVELFVDQERGGFFLTPVDGERLVSRKKDFDDHPTPSGNSMLAYVLLRLARLWGDENLERHAVSVFRLVSRLLPQAPSAFGHALCALDLHFSPPREIAVIGPPDAEVARAALASFDPNAVVAFGPSDEVPVLQGKGFVDGLPAVYVCENFACQAPVTDAARLEGALSDGRSGA